jgi:phage tail sheath protein FI
MSGTGEDRMGTITLIFSEVGRLYGVKLPQMFGPRRYRSIAWPRQVACYLASELTEASLPQIGRVCGGRDHTTILHAIRRVEDVTSHSKEKWKEVERIRAIVTNDHLHRFAAKAVSSEQQKRLIRDLQNTIRTCRRALRRLGVEDTDARA